MLKRTIFTAALAIALATPTLAQQNSLQPQRSTQADFVQNQSEHGWRGSKLIGASVYGPDNASIGEISDVLIGGDGAIRAVVVGVGGFLGITDKDVAIPFRAVTITRGPANGSIDKVIVNYSKQQLKDAPRFAFDQMASPQTTGADSAHGTDHQ